MCPLDEEIWGVAFGVAVRCAGWSPGSALQSSFPLKVHSGRQQLTAQARGSPLPWRKPGLNSRLLQTRPALAAVSIWGVSQHTRNLCLSLPLWFPTFAIKQTSKEGWDREWDRAGNPKFWPGFVRFELHTEQTSIEVQVLTRKLDSQV